ncbi:MAG: ribokinase [Shimia sp.]
MAVYNLGSINIDYVYRVAKIAAPGQTISARSLTVGLGGKGANQSVAVARAGAKAIHIGAVGPDGGDYVKTLGELGVDTTNVAEVKFPTGHAVIQVADDGENAITILGGANEAQDVAAIEAALSTGGEGDLFLAQNETNMTRGAARAAKAAGMRVVYSAAPFDASRAAGMLPHIDIIVLNEGEANTLIDELGTPLHQLPVAGVLTTFGAQGSRFMDNRSLMETWVDAHPATAIDTTGAGDCYLGFFCAGLDEGLTVKDAMELASKAAALSVTRAGATASIPTRAEVDALG